MIKRFYVTVLFAVTVLAAQTLPNSQSRPDPRRDPWQKPHEVIAALNFSPAETVAVIENGQPYFAQRIAPYVRRMYAVNSDPRAFQERGAILPGISPVMATYQNPHLSDLDLDTIMMVDVSQFIQHRPAYYLALAAGLKRGGRLVIIDRKLPPSIPASQRITDTEVSDELSASGFVLSEKWTILPYQFFLVFTH